MFDREDIELFSSPFPDFLRYAPTWESVTQEMIACVGDFLTPISEVESDDIGHAWGSGTYVQFSGNVYVLTNEHVARKMTECRIAHLPRAGDRWVPVTNPMQAVPWPIDAAISRIEPPGFHGATKRALMNRAFDPAFRARDYELLFFAGFPGFSTPQFSNNPVRRTTYFGELFMPGKPYCSQQVQLPPGYNPDMHFALSYPSEGAHLVGGGFQDPPNPKGMSGSLIWDTKFVASGGNSWDSSFSRVCGIARGWEPDHKCLICVKIEHVRSAIVDFLRREASYFRWLDAGQPTDRALEHWLWAESRIHYL